MCECECGCVLPLLPPVCRLINNGNAAALLKCGLATRPRRIISVPRRQSASGRNRLIHPSSWTHPASLCVCLQVDDPQGPLSKGDRDGSPSAPVPPSLKRQTASASLKVSPPAPSRQKSETQTDPSGGQQLEAETQPPLQVCSILQDGPSESPPVPSAPCSEPTKVRTVSSNSDVHEGAVGTSSCVFGSRANVALLRWWKPLLLRRLRGP